LRQLAKHLGVSHMSVSRNLREFERLIVESYLKG
jgi:predicted DNA binding protein